MDMDRDLSEFIECCVAREVRFLIVGGYAVAAHGHPRFTKDLDVWVWIDPGNARRLTLALADFGFGSLGLSDEDFAEPGMVVQLGTSTETHRSAHEYRRGRLRRLLGQSRRVRRGRHCRPLHR